jgi:hypothetical protein
MESTQTDKKRKEPELDDIGKQWMSLDSKKKKVMLKTITDIIKPQVKPFAVYGWREPDLTLSEVNARAEEQAKEVINKSCRSVIQKQLDAKEIDVDEIDNLMNKWFAKLKENKCQVLKPFDPDRTHFYGNSKDMSDGNGMFVLEFKPHKYAERCPLDYGRSEVLDIEKPFHFFHYPSGIEYAANGYYTKDRRHDHVRVASDNRSNLSPPKGSLKILREYINFEIYEKKPARGK